MSTVDLTITQAYVYAARLLCEGTAVEFERGSPEEGEDAGLLDLVAVHIRQRGAILCGVGGDARHEEAEEKRQGDGAVLHEGRTHRLDEDLAHADARLPNNSVTSDRYSDHVYIQLHPYPYTCVLHPGRQEDHHAQTQAEVVHVSIGQRHVAVASAHLSIHLSYPFTE